MAAGDVYRALWRHKFLILVLTVACVAATWYATSRQTKTYEAATLVRVQQQVGDPNNVLGSLQASQQLAQTYAEIIGSGALDARVARRLQSRLSGSDIAGVDVSGEPVADLDLLWLTARDENPRVAALVANSLPGVLQTFITSKRSALREQIVVVKPAARPTSPASPDLALNVGIAFVLALMFNSALVLLYEILRDRLPETDDLDDAVGYPVLATIPSLRLQELRTFDEGRGGLSRARSSDGRTPSEVGIRSAKQGDA